MDTRITFKQDKKHKYYLSYTQMYIISNIKAYSQHGYPKSIPAWTSFESEKVDDYNHKNYIQVHQNMQQLNIEQVKIQASKRRRSEKTAMNSDERR
jgi:hypothetical protein